MHTASQNSEEKGTPSTPSLSSFRKFRHAKKQIGHDAWQVCWSARLKGWKPDNSLHQHMLRGVTIQQRGPWSHAEYDEMTTLYPSQHRLLPLGELPSKCFTEKWTIKTMWSAGRPSRGSSGKWRLFHSLTFLFSPLALTLQSWMGICQWRPTRCPEVTLSFPRNVSLEKRTACELWPAGRVGIAVFQLDSPYTHHHWLSVTVRPTLRN